MTAALDNTFRAFIRVALRNPAKYDHLRTGFQCIEHIATGLSGVSARPHGVLGVAQPVALADCMASVRAFCWSITREVGYLSAAAPVSILFCGGSYWDRTSGPCRVKAE